MSLRACASARQLWLRALQPRIFHRLPQLSVLRIPRRVAPFSSSASSSSSSPPPSPSSSHSSSVSPPASPQQQSSIPSHAIPSSGQQQPVDGSPAAPSADASTPLTANPSSSPPATGPSSLSDAASAAGDDHVPTPTFLAVLRESLTKPAPRPGPRVQQDEYPPMLLSDLVASSETTVWRELNRTEESRQLLKFVLRRMVQLLVFSIAFNAFYFAGGFGYVYHLLVPPRPLSHLDIDLEDEEDYELVERIFAETKEGFEQRRIKRKKLKPTSLIERIAAPELTPEERAKEDEYLPDKPWQPPAPRVKIWYGLRTVQPAVPALTRDPDNPPPDL